MSERSVAVVGGGIAGLAAARRLVDTGYSVSLIEAGNEVGGLVRSFEIGGTPIERFYHHVFPQELTIQGLIREFGLADRFEWLPSRVGTWADGRVWPFTTATDLLRFAPLSPIGRVRAGVGALRMPRTKDWTALDDVRAIDWLTRNCGAEAAERIWHPLLTSKFGTLADDVPASWLWGRFDQRAGARRLDGREHLGYLRGGFAQLIDALEDDLHSRGVDIRTGTRVASLDGDDAVRLRLETDDQARDLVADAVVWTANPFSLSLATGANADPRWRASESMSVVSVVLELDRPLTDQYWINICDAEVPYGAIVEHTNFVPASDYGGRHVVYLARYLAPGDPVAERAPQAIADDWIADLHRRFPSFPENAVIDRHVGLAKVAAPVVQVGHLRRLPPRRTHLPGVYLASMHQVYPHDRGMNDGMELALDTAEDVAVDLGGPPGWSCPVCASRAYERAFSRPTSGEECGVRGDRLRPSSQWYGSTVGTIVRCSSCGHGSMLEPIDPDSLDAAYAEAEDDVTTRERDGQLTTADRSLARVEDHITPGRLLDVGAWTGAQVEAAQARGWDASGIEPSEWAVKIAGDRGLNVTRGVIDDLDGKGTSPFDAVTAMDVIEHLVDPVDGLRRIRSVMRVGGVLMVAVPDAGSALARVLGSRWWSVLPMHVQYFTRRSLEHAIRVAGFSVLETTTHPKAFSARYYAERLDGYAHGVSGFATRMLQWSGWSDRLIAPNLRDRTLVLARAEPVPEGVRLP